MSALHRASNILAAALIVAVTTAAVMIGAGASAQTPLPPSGGGQDKVVARVNGSEIRQSDILRSLQQLPPEVRQMPQGQLFTLLLERAVDRLLVVAAARNSDIINDANVQERLRRAEDDVLWESYLEREVAAGMTEARVRKAYDKVAGAAAEDELKARHILLASEEDARAVIRDLQGGADFEAVAREKSIGPSRETGGDLGYFNRDQMVAEFSDAAFALGVGEFSKAPVKTQFGWHVILVENRRRAEAPTMQQAMPQIRQEVTREVLTEVLGGLRKGADIQVVGSDGELVRP